MTSPPLRIQKEMKQPPCWCTMDNSFYCDLDNGEIYSYYLYIDLDKIATTADLHIHTLNTKFYSLKVLFRLVPPSFTCISTSARSEPPKIDPQLPSDVLCRFISLTTPTHYRAFNSQGLSWLKWTTQNWE